MTDNNSGILFIVLFCKFILAMVLFTGEQKREDTSEAGKLRKRLKQEEERNSEK